ncbi:MAG TPA: phage tail tip lysozyme [Kofleriaceae bacterium]
MNITHRQIICFLLASLLATGCTTEEEDSDDETNMSELALSSTEQTAFNFFVSKGLTKIQAAGVVGNLMQESNVKPGAVQPNGPGRGIAQWSVGGRWDTDYRDNVTWYANVHGLSRWALNTQLQFIWYELTTYGYGLSSLRAATTLTQAVVAFQNKFEMCGGTCRQSQRIAYAQQVLAANGGSGSKAGCYSHTLGMQKPHNACVQSVFDGEWYQCSNGAWVDRWTDPEACDGVYPL